MSPESSLVEQPVAPLRPNAGAHLHHVHGESLPNTGNPAAHFPGADVLRGVAILMVFVYHALLRSWPWQGYGRDFEHLHGKASSLLYPASFGWAGVSLFFVLSGFCIHLSFLRSREFSVSRFFWQRFWRIYPAYLVALVAFSICRRLDIASLAGLKSFLLHALLVHNFSGSSFFELNPSFWSLATEIQLYLLYPFLLHLRNRVGLAKCLGIAFALGLAWRLAAVIIWGLPDHVICPAYTSSAMTWFDWMLGAYVAEQLFQGRAAFSRRSLWLTAIIPAFVFSTLFKPFSIFSFTLAAIASAVVLDRCAAVRRDNLPFKTLSFIGLISYSIYLWHQPLLELLPRWIDAGSYLWPRLCTLACIAAISVGSYFFVERGGISLGRWLSKCFATRRVLVRKVVEE